ncbi:MAG: phosphoenolpyruvate-protein phosphotransferase system enzyme, partial [Actinomycetota bacterium]|nr:phosphoenolpyruvate-protein phosphotransferase system enzyme [Actinomycetota bacterium]
MPEPLRGLGVSPGVGAGPVFRVAAPPALPEQQPTVDDAAGEARRATEALEQVGAELEARAATATATAAEVLGAQAMIARDPTLAETVAGK